MHVARCLSRAFVCTTARACLRAARCRRSSCASAAPCACQRSVPGCRGLRREPVVSAMFRLSFACCCARILAAQPGQQQQQQGDLAADVGKAIADIAGRVALEDGYGEEFAAAFAPGARSLRAQRSPSDAVAFAGAEGSTAGHLVTLRPPAETTDDALRAISALEAAGSSKRAAAKESHASALQRVLEAEGRETNKILAAELARSMAAAAGQA